MRSPAPDLLAPSSSRPSLPPSYPQPVLNLHLRRRHHSIKVHDRRWPVPRASSAAFSSALICCGCCARVNLGGRRGVLRRRSGTRTPLRLRPKLKNSMVQSEMRHQAGAGWVMRVPLNLHARRWFHEISLFFNNDGLAGFSIQSARRSEPQVRLRRRMHKSGGQCSKLLVELSPT
jgi:hypothetical protein